jgi:hypothetical protein
LTKHQTITNYKYKPFHSIHLRLDVIFPIGFRVGGLGSRINHWTALTSDLFSIFNIFIVKLNKIRFYSVVSITEHRGPSKRSRNLPRSKWALLTFASTHVWTNSSGPKAFVSIFKLFWINFYNFQQCSIPSPCPLVASTQWWRGLTAQTLHFGILLNIYKVFLISFAMCSNYSLG